MNDQTQKVTIECITGDIVKQSDLDAVVNAANAELQSGGGVAGAIHRAAGPGLAQECRPMAPIAPGEAVLSSGHKLPNARVIHCLGPVYGKDEPSDQLLADCYRNALRLAEEKGIARIGFPAISTGAFGYPLEEAARVCAETVKASLPTLRQVECIRFVLFNNEARAELQAALERAGLAVSSLSQ
ncbi:macro domain-containing protein [Marinimicrobium agarilyticum]|uniref:macro domain-containing protein n=1 Tax=Marinimicrobium agarilyticum TaxID=306546 RepID=UPI000412E4C3|nr:macro domain-containing protein [Marinimicrobium agarilyticum]